MRAEFEEKSFEGALNLELAAQESKRIIFSPGQVLESVVGYDASSYLSSNHPIWNGDLFKFAEGDYDTKLREEFLRRGYPNPEIICCNLFIQYKRPEYLKRGAGAQRKKFKSKPFYRIELLENQHKILREQEKKLKNSVVVYAAPCFHLLKELHAHTINKTHLTNTFFIRPLQLSDKEIAVPYDKPNFNPKPPGIKDSITGNALNELINGFSNKKSPLELMNEYYNFLSQFESDKRYSKKFTKCTFINT